MSKFMYFFNYYYFSHIIFSIPPLIEGKGGGKKGQLQGKATTFKKLKDVEELIKQSLNS